MKVNSDVLNLLKFNIKARARLMYEFDVSEQTVVRWAEMNKRDGDLTRVKAVKLLAEELKMPVDNILMEEELV